MKEYDIAIIGGGLSGLSLAVLQAKAGKSVVLFEKNKYPFHRVCGEYISLESWDFLESLGVKLSNMELPIIKKLLVSSPSGNILTSPLDLGGFGISRYKLDYELAELAKNNGVHLLENTSVTSVKKNNGYFTINVDNQTYTAKKTIGSFGKRSNLDINWNRAFILKNRTSLNQYIGVKYHIKIDFPKDLIALHNFKDGYCGISAVENGLYCLCYMTTKRNLKENENSIALLEKNVLQKNPHLKNIFETSVKMWDKPEVISQISFEKKELVFNDVTLIGDASGMIAPLCGNGMSMAMHAAYLLNNNLNEGKNAETYQQTWKQNFKTRLWVGRTIQRFFGNEFTTNLLISIFKKTPSVLKLLIAQTHGKRIGN